MKTPLLIILLSVFVYGVGLAQLKASFTASTPNNCSVPAHVYFTITSTIDPQHGTTKHSLNYGDGSAPADGSDGFSHYYLAPGIYPVTLIETNDIGSDTAVQNISINSLTLTYSNKLIGNNCSKAIELFSANVQSALPDSLSYTWQISGGTPGYLIGSSDSSVVDSFNTPADALVDLKVTSRSGNYCFYYSESVSISTAMPILPSEGPHVLAANRQCVNDYDGWTHYYYDNNTPDDESDDSLVLSLRLFGEDVGTIGDGTFSVKIAATPGAGSDSAVLITNPVFHNPLGFWAMNRYWSVTPTRQPTKQVQVRFYFNDQDFVDVKNSFEKTSAYKLEDADDLVFYKTVNGNSDPTTNLAGTDSVILLHYIPSLFGDLNDYVDFNVYSPDIHVADFFVTSLTGGGGGYNNYNQVLPVQLTSFTATNNGNKVNLQWTTAQEINVSKYEVQVSADGRQFTTLGTLPAHGKTSPDTYAFSYEELKLNQAYYRLVIVDQNGIQTSSNTIPLLFNRINKMVALYPNPAKNSVQVKAAMFENKQAIADVYNSAGIKVSTIKLYFSNSTATLHTSTLVSGHYTVVLRNEQNVAHVPLVIVK